MVLRGENIRFCTLDTPCRKGSNIEVTNPAIMSESPPRCLVCLASQPLISSLWGVFHTTVFLVHHFVIMIVNVEDYIMKCSSDLVCCKELFELV